MYNVCKEGISCMVCWCLHNYAYVHVIHVKCTQLVCISKLVGLLFVVVLLVFCWSLWLFILDAYNKTITSMLVRCVYCWFGFAGRFCWCVVPVIRFSRSFRWYYVLLVHCSCGSVFPLVFPVFSLVYVLLVRCWSVVCVLLWLVFAGYFGSVIHRG